MYYQHSSHTKSKTQMLLGGIFTLSQLNPGQSRKRDRKRGRKRERENCSKLTLRTTSKHVSLQALINSNIDSFFQRIYSFLPGREESRKKKAPKTLNLSHSRTPACCHVCKNKHANQEDDLNVHFIGRLNMNI